MMNDYEFSDVGDRLLFGRFERPTAATTTRIAVVGDPHVATRARGTYRVFHRTEQRLRTVIDDVNDRDVDLVFFPGDLTKDGEPWNFDCIDTLLEELEHPFLATPGNHDVQKRTDDYDCPSSATFANRYASGSLPLHHEVGGVDLFVLNTAVGPDGPYLETHRGLLSTDQLEWLDDRLGDVDDPIVACHHNPLPVVSDPICRIDPWKNFTLRKRDRFISVLEDHDVPLVLAGHHHLPALVRRNDLRQLIAPAVASYPQAYCLLKIDKTGTTVELVSNATETGRSEAYDLAVQGPSFRRTLLDITSRTLESLPVVYEPPRIDGEPLTD